MLDFTQKSINNIYIEEFNKYKRSDIPRILNKFNSIFGFLGKMNDKTIELKNDEMEYTYGDDKNFFIAENAVHLAISLNDSKNPERFEVIYEKNPCPCYVNYDAVNTTSKDFKKFADLHDEYIFDLIITLSQHHEDYNIIVQVLTSTELNDKYSKYSVHIIMRVFRDQKEYFYPNSTVLKKHIEISIKGKSYASFINTQTYPTKEPKILRTIKSTKAGKRPFIIHSEFIKKFEVYIPKNIFLIRDLSKSSILFSLINYRKKSGFGLFKIEDLAGKDKKESANNDEKTQNRLKEIPMRSIDDKNIIKNSELRKNTNEEKVSALSSKIFDGKNSSELNSNVFNKNIINSDKNKNEKNNDKQKITKSNEEARVNIKNQNKEIIANMCKTQENEFNMKIYYKSCNSSKEVEDIIRIERNDVIYPTIFSFLMKIVGEVDDIKYMEYLKNSNEIKILYKGNCIIRNEKHQSKDFQCIYISYSNIRVLCFDMKCTLEKKVIKVREINLKKISKLCDQKEVVKEVLKYLLTIDKEVKGVEYRDYKFSCSLSSYYLKKLKLEKIFKNCIHILTLKNHIIFSQCQEIVRITTYENNDICVNFKIFTNFLKEAAREVIKEKEKTFRKSEPNIKTNSEKDTIVSRDLGFSSDYSQKLNEKDIINAIIRILDQIKQNSNEIKDFFLQNFSIADLTEDFLTLFKQKNMLNILNIVKKFKLLKLYRIFNGQLYKFNSEFYESIGFNEFSLEILDEYQRIMKLFFGRFMSFKTLHDEIEFFKCYENTLFTYQTFVDIAKILTNVEKYIEKIEYTDILVEFENAIFCFKNEDLLDFGPENFVTNILPYEFTYDYDESNFNDYINQVFRPDDANIIFEHIGRSSSKSLKNPEIFVQTNEKEDAEKFFFNLLKLIFNDFWFEPQIENNTNISSRQKNSEKKSVSKNMKLYILRHYDSCRFSEVKHISSYKNAVAKYFKKENVSFTKINIGIIFISEDFSKNDFYRYAEEQRIPIIFSKNIEKTSTLHNVFKIFGMDLSSSSGSLCSVNSLKNSKLNFNFARDIVIGFIMETLKFFDV